MRSCHIIGLVAQKTPGRATAVGRTSASFLIDRLEATAASETNDCIMRQPPGRTLPAAPAVARTGMRRGRGRPEATAGAESALHGRGRGGFRAGGGRTARILIRMRGEWRPGMHGALDIGDVTVLPDRWLGTAVAGEY